MIKRNKSWWLIIIFVVLQACEINQPTHIPDKIWPHVKEFVAQAKQRGILIKTEGLKITFVNGLKDEEGNPLNGKYSRWYFPLKAHQIELDTTQYWWIGATSGANVTYAREKVIFHELAHCFLNRKHKFETFDSFTGHWPKSIMGVTILPTYEMNPDFRNYYLDELFNEFTPAPDWAKKAINVKEAR